MAYQFSANLTVQNADRFELANVAPQRSVKGDPTSIYEVHVEFELRAGNSGNTPLALYGEYTVVVRNGQSDVIRVRTPAEWVPRAPISERLLVVRHALSTPTGMTTFLAALGAGNTNALLNAALNALKTLGVIDQSTLARDRVMPLVIVTDKEKPMGKKKGFLDYGKDDEPEKDDDEGGDDEEESDGDASGMRLQHLAEQTGVEDPKALIKLIKACMQQG